MLLTCCVMIVLPVHTIIEANGHIPSYTKINYLVVF